MIIKALVENTSVSNHFASEHGLSLYIETTDSKILFDVGASGLFLENAKKLNVNISDVDYLIISHGHCDHAGGLRTFLNENIKAKVFVQPLAFGKYYALRPNGTLEFIGLEDELKKSKQIVFTSGQLTINKGIEVFSNVYQKESYSILNSGLLMECDQQKTKDDFAHEQNLVIEEDNKTLLVTGCAHNGIINILEHFYDLKGYMPDYVIGGFHLSSRTGGDENNNTLDKIAKYLINTKAKYYTCHCTGIEPYNRLKELMGKSIVYMSAGSVISTQGAKILNSKREAEAGAKAKAEG